MARQQKISARRLKRKVGTRQQIIIDEVGPTVSKGRSKADAPEIDGAVYLSSRRPSRVGEIVTAKIERADQYDLHGSVAESEFRPRHAGKTGAPRASHRPASVGADYEVMSLLPTPAVRHARRIPPWLRTARSAPPGSPHRRPSA